MTHQKKLLTNSFWNITGYLYLLIASLISLPFIVHGLGAEGYARYLIIIAIFTIASTFDFGLPTALVRSLSQKDDDKSTKMRTFRVGLTGMLVLAAIAALAASYALVGTRGMTIWQSSPDALYSSLYALLSLVVVTHLVSYFGAVAQGRQDFAIANTRAFIVGTGNTMLAAVTALITEDLVMVLWVQVASGVFALFLLMFYAVTEYSGALLIPAFSGRELKKQLKFGFPIFLGNLAPQLQANMTRLISGVYLSPPVIATIGIAQSLVVKGTGLFNQVTTALFPTAVSLADAENRRELKALTRKVTVLFVAVTLLALGVTIVIGQPLLDLWLQNSSMVKNMYPLLIAYLMYAVIIALTPVPATTLTALGMPQIPARTAWIHVLLELVLLLILLPRLGALGAPYAATAAVAVSTALLLYAYLRVK